MARGADVMVHETTLEQAMAEKANSRGHSSSQQTAALAKEAGVGTLIATHFSSRYDAEGCLKMLAECREIFRQYAIGGRLYGLQDGVKSGHKKTAIPAVFLSVTRRLHQRRRQLHDASRSGCGQIPSTSTSRAEISTTIPPALYCRARRRIAVSQVLGCAQVQADCHSQIVSRDQSLSRQPLRQPATTGAHAHRRPARRTYR